MTIAGMLVNLGVIVGIIGTIALLKYTGVLDVLISSFDWVKYFISWLMENRIFAVMFFILLIGVFSSVVSFMIGLNYACDSQNRLREQNFGVVSGFAMFIAKASSGINSTDTTAYNNLVNSYTTLTSVPSQTSAKGLMSVNCINRDPKLMLFGRVDFLNFKYWMLILLIVGLVKIISTVKQWV
jgi:hypothetical protein